MKADEFLKYSGEHYNENKKKWSARLQKQGLKFSEDIYQDSIIKVYDHINNKEYDGTDIEAYWYQAFLNNTRRDIKYAYHKRDDDVDVFEYLKDVPVEDRGIYISDIEDKLKSLNEIDKYIFLMYYLTDLTFMELEELTNIKDMRYRLKKIRGYIKREGD